MNKNFSEFGHWFDRGIVHGSGVIETLTFSQLVRIISDLRPRGWHLKSGQSGSLKPVALALTPQTWDQKSMDRGLPSWYWELGGVDGETTYLVSGKNPNSLSSVI